jgi:hypothetical protein
MCTEKRAGVWLKGNFSSLGGVFIGILGVLIRFAGMMHPIASYEPEQVADEEGLATFIGSHTLYVALLTICVGMLELGEQTMHTEWYWLINVIAILTIAVRMIRGAREYESP